MVKLKKQVEGITFDQLKDGQIGVIVEHVASSYVGIVVQKHDGNLIVVGGDTEERFTTLRKVGSSVLIKPLKNGTELIIENNE